MEEMERKAKSTIGIYMNILKSTGSLEDAQEAIGAIRALYQVGLFGTNEHDKFEAIAEVWSIYKDANTK